MAILAATMISRAASGSFEWMYPLRFAAAAGALLLFRRKYASLDWTFGWAAPAVGALVLRPLDRPRSNRRKSHGELHTGSTSRLTRCLPDHMACFSDPGRGDHRPHRRGTGLSRLPSSPFDFGGFRIRQFSTLDARGCDRLFHRFWSSAWRSLDSRKHRGLTLRGRPKVARENRGRNRGAWSHQRSYLNLGAVGWPLVFVVGANRRNSVTCG